MAVSPYTNEFMRALPAALRPNPFGIDEYVMQAVANGWSVSALAEACYAKDRNPNPAFVATNVKHLCQHPPTTAPRPTGWAYGHVDCDTHEGCQVCRCQPDSLEHVVPVPMPQSFKDEWKRRFVGWGSIPDA